MPNARGTRRGFGSTRKLPSGRYQARYTGLDGEMYKAPRTFHSKDDAIEWLNKERRKIDLGTWSPPSQAAAPTTDPAVLTLRAYAERWHEDTAGRHKPRYRNLNRGYLDRLILPTLGDAALTELSAADVRTWRAALDEKYPTRNANAYGLLRTILNQAVDDELLTVNPCRVRGGAVKHRVREPVALSAAQVRELAAAMKQPRYRAFVLVAGFSGLRWGEMTALRRGDFDFSDNGIAVTVARAVVYHKGGWVVGRPKSKAALRTVPLPDQLRQPVLDHLDKYAGPGRASLAFPALSGEYLQGNTLKEPLRAAAQAIGLDLVTPHDLRHTAATLFAEAGATLADHMTLMGHTSSAMSARYTHSTAARTRGLVQKTWDAK